MRAARSSRRLTEYALGAWLALTLGACGVSSAGGTAGAGPQTTSSATARSATVTPTATASSGAPGAASGVSVTSGKARYAPADAIKVTIHNALGAPIYAANTHTACTAVTLEWHSSNSWQAVAPCVNTYPHPNLVEIAPGSTLTAQLQPSQGGSGSAAWQTGTYRVLLAYLTGPTQSLGQASIVYSTTFVVG